MDELINGIDISYHNGDVDLAAAKAGGIDFVIIRMGYGDNTIYQDDKQFLNNVRKARQAGMRWGLYLYSYARNMEQVQSEVLHSVRLVRAVGRPPLGVWWDSEDASTSTCNLKNFFSFYKQFVERYTGVPVGLYSYKAFFDRNYSGIEKKEFPFWYARYNNSLPADHYKDYCDIWQYSSDAHVRGVAGVCDVNRMHRRSITAVLQVWKGLYSSGEERKKYLIDAGYNPVEVQKLVNEYGKAADDVIEDKYGAGEERVRRLEKAGFNAYIVQQIVNIKIMER